MSDQVCVHFGNWQCHPYFSLLPLHVAITSVAEYHILNLDHEVKYYKIELLSRDGNHKKQTKQG